MAKNTKVWLIVAAALILLGCIIFAGVMTMLGWDFTKLGTGKFETNTHTVSQEFSGISIDVHDADIRFVATQDGTCKVECYERTNATHKVTVEDGCLSISVVDVRKWYDRIGIFMSAPKITVYMPAQEYGQFILNGRTGSAEIPGDFSFESMDVSVSTGKVTNYASATGEIKIKTTTGSICTKNITVGSLSLSVSTGDITAESVSSQGNVQVKVSTGRANLQSIVCQDFTSTGDTGDFSIKDVTASGEFYAERSTGDVELNRCTAAKLDVKTDTGDVTLEQCDAEEIKLETDTGDVTGSLLSEKIFFANSNTGSVEVPKTTTGGVCEIETDTGNIEIKIAE